MDTMQLVPSTPTTDLTTLGDDDIEAFFAAAGLNVSVVPHCDDATCGACFGQTPAKAA